MQVRTIECFADPQLQNGTGTVVTVNDALQLVSSLPELTGLHFSGTSFPRDQTVQVARALVGATALTTLAMRIDSRQGCFVTDGFLEKLISLRGLTRLEILGGPLPLTDGGVQALGQMSSLMHLGITLPCTVTESGVQALCNLSALTHLELSHSSNNTDNNIKALCGVSALTRLDISDRRRFLERETAPRLTQEGIKALSSFSALTYLKASFSPHLSDESLKGCMRSACSLPALTHLDLAGAWVKQGGHEPKISGGPRF